MFIRRDFSTSMFFSFNCLCRSENSLRFFSLYSSNWLWSSRVDVLEISTISDIWAESAYTKGSIVLNETKVFFSSFSIQLSIFKQKIYQMFPNKLISMQKWENKTVRVISNSMCSKTFLFWSVSSSSSWVTQWTAQAHFSMSVLSVQFKHRWHNKSDAEAFWESAVKLWNITVLYMTAELRSGLYRTGLQCHFEIVVFQSLFQPWSF